mgnify:CR=1 FL=1
MRKIILAFAVLTLLFLPLTAYAIPDLQVYIEGASYGDQGADQDTWFSSGNPFILWAVGQTKQNEKAEIVPITGVTLVITYPSTEFGSITLTPTTASLSYNTWIGSDPAVPSIFDVVGSGDWPNNAILPPHYPCQDGFSYTLLSISDFTEANSYVGNWAGAGVPPPFSNPSFFNGEIHAFEISFTGFSYLHFDVTGYQGEKYINNPFSHDASVVVPLPGSLILLGSGILSLVGLRKKLL